MSHSSKPGALAVFLVVVALSAPTSAQFAPSGGALPHARESAELSIVPEAEVPEEPKRQIAGFEKGNFDGFYVQSRDGEFRLNLGAYTQFRYNLLWRETPPVDESDFNAGFTVPRTFFFFEGRFTSAIEYHLRINITEAGDFAIQVAYAGYNFKDYHHRSRHNHGAWNLRVGRQFLALTREDWMTSQDSLTTEASAVDQTFGPGSVDGVQAFYGRDRGRLWFALSNGLGGGNESFPNNLTSQALISARGEVQLLGDDWNNYNDLVGRRGHPFGILLGIGSGYGIRGPNAPPDDPKHFGQVTADLTLAGNGFQVLTYGVWNWEAVGTAQSTWGFVAQGGYFILDPWQVYVRYELVDPGRIQGLTSFNALTIGSSLFPFDWTNRYKLSAEGGLLFSAINQTLVVPTGVLGWAPADEGNQYYLRFQLQFGF